jgi:antitoxin component YwqK of YwqJK toxin-antitoxin module
MWRTEAYGLSKPQRAQLDHPDGGYDGMCFNETPYGSGEISYKDGTTFVGDFVSGLPHGLFYKKYTNGDILEVDYRYGKRNGTATMYHKSGSKSTCEYNHEGK